MAEQPRRPPDRAYYEPRIRVALFSQGDIFRDVPLAYPVAADEMVVDLADDGRRFLSGPLTFGPAMLVTPSCSLAQQRGTGYSHPVRTLVPLIPLEVLVEQGMVKATSVDQIRSRDVLINYMYLPPLELPDAEFFLPESLALLYMPITLHHDLIDGQRVAQLAYEGARQLHLKLTRHYTGLTPAEGRDVFDPPMD